MQIDGIEIHVTGPMAAETIVMVHGWPDTYRLWDRQVSALSSHYRCVRFTLPGFDRDKPPRAYSLDEVVGFIERVCQAVSAEAPVTLLVHDWGCLFGYEFLMRHPSRVSRLIGVDIGDASSSEYLHSLSVRQKLMIAGYQLWLALAWAIGGGVGERMTRGMARAMRCPSPIDSIGVGMTYPYMIRWTGRHGGYRRLRPFDPPVPMLYLYGRRKPFMFHSPQWLAALSARPGSRVIALPTSHWVMLDAPAEFNAAVIDWLNEQKGCQQSQRPSVTQTGGT